MICDRELLTESGYKKHMKLHELKGNKIRVNKFTFILVKKFLLKIFNLDLYMKTPTALIKCNRIWYR